MNEILILDCYIDERPAWPNFVALMPGRAHRAIRVAKETAPADIDGFAGLMLTGGGASAVDGATWLEPVYDLIREARNRALPTLGICFGHQLIPRALFGASSIRRAPRSEFGWREISCTTPNQLLEGVPERFECFLSHSDEVTPGIPELDVFAHSERCEVQGYQVRGLPMWGLQFHPEMPLDESTRLVHSNLARHTHIKETPEELLSHAVDARPLGLQLFANFLATVDATASTA